MTDALARLILAALDTGASYQQLADRARDPKTGTTLLSKSYLQKIATGAVANAPTPDRLNAIATALRIPLPVVQAAAAAQFLGYQPTDDYDDDTRIILGHLAAMTRRDRHRWRAMIEAAVAVVAEEGEQR